MATYIVKADEYDSATAEDKATLKALRLSDNSVVGSTESIESDVILPNTRIPSVPDTGAESSSGSLECEFNIDEQDDLIASALCTNWVEDSSKETGDVTSYKYCKLGTTKQLYYMIKYFDQAPVEYRMFNGLQVNQMTMTLALNSFAKLSFDMLGANNPQSVSTDPTVNAEYGSAMTTKAFKTLEGYIKIGSSFDSLTALRQCPSFDMTVNNNKEATQALFESEAIEMSDGNFEVTGNIEIWKADSIGMTMFNDAVVGADKCIEVQLSRTVGDTKTSYTFKLKAHCQAPSESKDGSKYKVTVPYSVNVADGIEIIKQVENV